MKLLWSLGLRGYTRRAYRRWERALRHPEQAQTLTLWHVLRLQRRLKLPSATEQTLAEGLAVLRQLPLQSYDDLPDVSGLTHQPPLFYELTSGSSGAKKRIPYTRALLQGFTEMFLCWAHDLLQALHQQGRDFQGGQVYFSVSPQFMGAEDATTPAAGLQDDGDYLTGLSAHVLRRFQAVPSTVRYLRDPEHFWDVVALGLLRAPQLEVISVWSPSFLRVLQAHVQSHHLRLSTLLASKTLTYEGRTFRLPVPPPARQRALQAALTALPDSPATVPAPWVWRTCFPHLKLISCWGAGHAAPDFAALRRDFAFAHVQEKGLLATEAPLTVPSEKYGGFLPLPQTVFYEFLPLERADDTVTPLLLHELTVGQRYEVVISQASGLLRYRLKDVVYVTGKQGLTPVLRFEGRLGAVSDLVGEKLQADFVNQGLQQCYGDLKTCLLPQRVPAHYVLCSEKPVELTHFEAYLQQNPHYANARALGQLGPLQSCVVPALPQRLRDYFVQHRHMKWGDIKDEGLYYRESDGAMLRFLQQWE